MKRNLHDSVSRLMNELPPDLPLDFEATVFQKISHRSSSNETNFSQWLSELFSHKTWVFSALAAAAFLSVSITMATANQFKPDRKLELNLALGFDTITTTHLVNWDKR